MRRIRVIPVLLLSDGGVVKTSRFKSPQYIGDPINTVKIFNDKEVDELVVLDIDATRKKSEPDFELIEEMASEAFMPLAYGGGIENVYHAEKAFGAGVEKIVINSSFWSKPELIRGLSQRFGSQSIVISIDVKKAAFNKTKVLSHCGSKNIKISPEKAVQMAEESGAGEILVTSINNEGTYKGYDLELITKLSATTSLPVIANGGAGKIDDFSRAIQAGASAVSAGSLFVYAGNEKGILINYPKQRELSEKVYSLL